jgi:3-oxoacyl-[acyl-carrier-protein] synthase II
MDIVVSGIGLVTPLGSSREKTWTRLIQGESAIEKKPHGFEARVYDFSLNGARSRTGDFALLAAAEALSHAGLTPRVLQKKVVGCAVSQSKPILSSMIDPALLFSTFFGWSPEAVIRRKFRLTGPGSNIVAACATGIASIELGAHWIRSGQCDVALVGAAESSLHPFYQTGFSQMGVLAEGESLLCVQPFDKNRSGFAMGEGSAVLVLEKKSSADRRGHKPLALLKAAVLQQSIADALRFDPSGESVERLIRHTNVTPDYVNAHGTGTRYNDAVESRGLRLAFGAKADRIPVSSTKAATGHLLGAAGAVEAAFCVLAIRDQVVPPTLHLTSSDPVCDLDYVPQKSRKHAVQTTLSLSYGFGGQMGAVAFASLS